MLAAGNTLSFLWKTRLHLYLIVMQKSTFFVRLLIDEVAGLLINRIVLTHQQNVGKRC